MPELSDPQLLAECDVDTYRGPEWTVESVHLVASFLGEGPGNRPRYETVASFPLGSPA